MASELHPAARDREPAVARIAAVGDLHVGPESAGSVRAGLSGIERFADLLLIAGDLTQHGSLAEGELLAKELFDLGVPVVAVFGNHDYHLNAEAGIRRALESAGVIVLEAETTVVQVNGIRVGVAGAKGFGGGFAGACATEFGEPEMKAYIRHTKRAAERLGDCLRQLDADVRVALTHYAPIKQTLQGERLEIYPFLGSYLIGEAIDAARVDLALHGHAHRGVEHGVTPGGVPVRNVARHVIQHAYKVYRVGPHAAVPTPSLWIEVDA